VVKYEEEVKEDIQKKEILENLEKQLKEENKLNTFY
jgi:hypothetical protein